MVNQVYVQVGVQGRLDFGIGTNIINVYIKSPRSWYSVCYDNSILYLNMLIDFWSVEYLLQTLHNICNKNIYFSLSQLHYNLTQLQYITCDPLLVV